MGLLSALTRSRLATLSGARKRALQGLMDEEPVTRLPVNPAREIGPGGLPIAPGQPFRQSFVGGTEDLLEAVRMGRISWPEFVALLTAGGLSMQKAPHGGAGGALVS